jgi:DNA modification methylase
VRKADPAQVARVEKSIRSLGCCRPVTVGDDLVVIDGHAIRDAAIRLQLPTIPILRVGHLSPAEQRALTIALNRTAETGTWDLDALTLEISELVELDQDVLSLGFERAEIDGLLIDDIDRDEAEDRLPPVPNVAISRLGDVWVCGDHVLIVGDARDPQVYTRLFADGQTARLIATDPPFNVPISGHCTTQHHHRPFAFASGEMTAAEYLAFTRAWMSAALPHLVEGGLLASFIDWRGIEVILATARGLELDLINMIVWGKSDAGMGSLWRSQHELLPVFAKPDGPHVNNISLGKWGRNRSNLWLCPGASTSGSEANKVLSKHPTPKPVSLLKDLLLDVTNRGDVVLDGFLGSGTAMIAAETTGRACRGIEFDPLYADLAVERWQTATGRVARLADTDESPAQVALRRQAEEGRS